jgi:hypothetical protein
MYHVGFDLPHTEHILIKKTKFYYVAQPVIPSKSVQEKHSTLVFRR